MTDCHMCPRNFSLDHAARAPKESAPMINPSANSVMRLLASDDVPVVYCVRPASPEAPIVALVHSVALDHHFWDAVAGRLAGRATLIAIDARGHGCSGSGRTPYKTRRMALDLFEVLEELGVSRAIDGCFDGGVA